MAMAPPLTFTMSVFQAMSRLTASACAANASFASTRSRSATFQPAFSSARRDAGIGPDPHDGRANAGGGPGSDPGKWCDAAPPRLVRAHDHERGGTVVQS